jgi:hypothetical protein
MSREAARKPRLSIRKAAHTASMPFAIPWGVLIRSPCKSTGFVTRLSLCTPRVLGSSPSVGFGLFAGMFIIIGNALRRSWVRNGYIRRPVQGSEGLSVVAVVLAICRHFYT